MYWEDLKTKFKSHNSFLKAELNMAKHICQIGQGLLDQMDRTLRACTKFESSNLGLILGHKLRPGGDFLDYNFSSSKNSG